MPGPLRHGGGEYHERVNPGVVEVQYALGRFSGIGRVGPVSLVELDVCASGREVEAMELDPAFTSFSPSSKYCCASAWR
jgi:hypothetical protein